MTVDVKTTVKPKTIQEEMKEIRGIHNPIVTPPPSATQMAGYRREPDEDDFELDRVSLRDYLILSRKKPLIFPYDYPDEFIELIENRNKLTKKANIIRIKLYDMTDEI